MAKKKRSPVIRSFDCAATPIQPPVLCLGIDLTWWGGSNKRPDRDSRRECIAYALKTQDGWQRPRFKRIELAGFNVAAGPTEANADADGQAVCDSIREILKENEATQNVVIALDAPLKACFKNLPPRKKKQEEGEVERRLCDKAWAEKVATSPLGWRNVNIQPGAPLPARVSAIIRELTAEHFELYACPTQSLSPRILIECFPNEVLWSAGVLGQCKRLTFSSMTAYKQIGKVKAQLPVEILKQIAEYTVKPCLRLAELPVNEWFESFWESLAVDSRVVKEDIGVAGKSFDDAVDSLLSLCTATAFTDGQAHLHIGDDPNDGHIIGPGLKPLTH